MFSRSYDRFNQNTVELMVKVFEIKRKFENKSIYFLTQPITTFMYVLQPHTIHRFSQCITICYDSRYCFHSFYVCYLLPENCLSLKSVDVTIVIAVTISLSQ